MSGIAGIVDLKASFNLAEKIEGMLSLMKHEEWYKVQQFHQRPVALGRASPGIIDPYPQPVFSQDKSLCLVMYGEIYDYHDEPIDTIKKALPCEPGDHPSLILRLIERKGIQIVKSLNGSFVLALWDIEKKVLTIANDRFGLRPLYYFRRDDLFIFASEMKSVLTFEEVDREIDIEAMAQFFSFNFIMGDRTWFKEIKVLSPASILNFENGSLKKRSYWTPDLAEEDKAFNKQDALERAHFLIKQAVHRQIKDDIPKILSLSGGLDSRTILGAAAQLGYKIPTFTFGIPECEDQRLAKAIADTLGMENHFFVLSPNFLEEWSRLGVGLTEGMNNCVNFHGIEFVPQLREKASVVLNGLFGNEVFGLLSLASVRFFLERRAKTWMTNYYRQLNHPFPESVQPDLFQAKYYSEVKGLVFQSLAEILDNCPAVSPFNKLYYFRFTEQARKSSLYGLVLDNNLVEYRVPFCDYDLVDFSLSIPPKQRLLAAFYRELLSKRFSPLDEIPYQRTGLPVRSSLGRVLLRKAKERIRRKILPSGVQERRYTDYDHWMRNQLRGFLSSVLLSERALNRGYFKPDYVERLVEEHLSAKRNLSSQLGALLTFELWNQLFVDEIKNPLTGCV